MTKERKLAIQMWEEIKYLIPMWLAESEHEYAIVQKIIRHKRSFCLHANVEWRNHCWFCQYISDCHNCPLNTCLPRDSSYSKVLNITSSVERRQEACDEIINALKGVKND